MRQYHAIFAPNGIHIALLTKLNILQHNANLCPSKHIFQHFWMHAYLDKPFCIFPCHANILHHFPNRSIHLRLLDNFQGWVIHNFHKCFGLFPAVHIKPNINFASGTSDNPILVNYM